MHRLVAGASDGEIVDHINRDRTDNRKSNLRITNTAGNAQNSVHLYGDVSLMGVGRSQGKYRARTSIAGRQALIGTFDDPIKAAQAYDAAVRKYHGEFAVTNESLGLIDAWRGKYGNQWETPCARATKSGVTGVTRTSCGTRWQAYIGAGRKRIHLGRFQTLDAAIAARKNAERAYRVTWRERYGIGEDAA